MTIEPYPFLVSGLFFGASLTLTEIARRWLGVAADVTRQAVVLTLGVWSIPAATLFREPAACALFYVVLAFALYVSFRYEILRSVEDAGPSLGSVLAPLSIAILFYWRQRDPYVAVAGAVTMAFGDTAAALVGRRLGSRKFRIWGHPRTMEGTLALFLAASASLAPVLALMGGLDWHQATAFALIAATAAASVETISVSIDNLTVPLSVSATLALLLRASA